MAVFLKSANKDSPPVYNIPFESHWSPYLRIYIVAMKKVVIKAPFILMLFWNVAFSMKRIDENSASAHCRLNWFHAVHIELLENAYAKML